MNIPARIFEAIASVYESPELNTTTIVSTLCMALLLAAFEYLAYRFVSHRAFYNRAFHICIAVLPLFLSTIVLILQSNLVLTLGTIGTLAIVRFRTALKDPVDMVYILWSVHIGITCGCHLYELAVLTSLLVAVVLLVLDRIPLAKAPYTLVVHMKRGGVEENVLACIKPDVRRFRVKSRNYTLQGIDLVLDLAPIDPKRLSEHLAQVEEVERFSLLEYDAEDIL
jgi:hypothetical protein